MKSGGVRSSSFNSFLSPNSRSSREKLEPPRSPQMSQLRDKKKKNSRFNVTIIDTKDCDNDEEAAEKMKEEKRSNDI